MMCKIVELPKFMWQNIRRSANSQISLVWFKTLHVVEY